MSAEWVTQCNRCGSPVRVSIPPQERASMECFCERCFNEAPHGGEASMNPGGPQVEPLPAGFTGFIPEPVLQPPAKNAVHDWLMEEPSGVKPGASSAAASDAATLPCPVCQGAGRIRPGVG